jgi:hypothetical protein
MSCFMAPVCTGKAGARLCFPWRLYAFFWLLPDTPAASALQSRNALCHERGGVATVKEKRARSFEGLHENIALTSAAPFWDCGTVTA